MRISFSPGCDLTAVTFPAFPALEVAAGFLFLLVVFAFDFGLELSIFSKIFPVYS
jgi:hypothetical protein